MTEKKDSNGEDLIVLCEDIDYADDSIVSKSLAKQSGGNITLFAFDTGQSLSEHTAPFDAIVQIIEGEAELTVGGKVFVVSEGQMTTVPAKIPHSVTARTPFKMLLTMLRT